MRGEEEMTIDHHPRRRRGVSSGNVGEVAGGWTVVRRAE